MEWVDGLPLDGYIRNCIDSGNEELLPLLSYRFGLFASWLAGQPFAHGDLKPDNLLVRPDGSLVAVDYDGMFVPAMAERGVSSSEMGSPDYRHPKRTSASFGPAMDHFSLAVMALSLEAIATDPSLLECYAEADGLLFCERDFFSLSDSEALRHVFALLPKSPNLQLLYSLFALVYKKMTLPMELSDCFRLPLPKNNSPKSSSSRTFIVNGVSFVMKLVKAGTFRMGATPEMNDGAFDDEFPVHKVTLTKDYYMGETQVTQALWQAVMGENPSWFTGDDQRPVECVSWNDCQDFIEQLNRITGEHFRLPTEAEWEFAARGGNESKGCRYAGSNDLDEVAWYDEDLDKGSTHPVAGKQPNELGLYGMSGNVYEWCSDWYDGNYYQDSPDVDPQGPASGHYRVLRGGSCGFIARSCRLSDRGVLIPEDRNYDCGLRLSL
jgi:formylglycine-generating enzyme required for sulfatase activity